ncbi:phage holin family protein [Xanthomonas translucens]|uniref:phage holin family protein n=1 Tax=Xanthomonas campestris pv. translucens TaxID=343 RepID=UPI0021B72339|nr:phage holin family protein [Xanthomonas translucens]MCT8273349.1 phage holin family protein [Xanthomonas translucens pv. translucens]MCT8277507.1 phage holin family protein [Xanthomonas translucens pv. translucens]MCT8306300.1 phage holin family protein [Xanthomonas translucens pv. translucens]WNJ27806.1 phage holin family protein [Xanthomonas translucens pv. translucens]
MTEPTSVSSGILIATGVGLASILPGIDGDALIGAFAGGALFVVSSTKDALIQRLFYFAISVVAGYQLAPEILRWLPIKSSGVAAFGSAACAITVTLGLIQKSKSIDLSFLRRGGPPSA